MTGLPFSKTRQFQHPMKTSPRLPVFAAIFALALSAMAQVPDTLKYSITGPATYVPPVQSKTHFGWSVAVNGSYTVVGEPGDAIPGRAGLGSVAVFDTVSGAELLVLTQPAPTSESGFGTSVAISGTLAVVGAPDDYGPGMDRQGWAARTIYSISSAPRPPCRWPSCTIPRPRVVISSAVSWPSPEPAWWWERSTK